MSAEHFSSRVGSGVAGAKSATVNCALSSALFRRVGLQLTGVDMLAMLTAKQQGTRYTRSRQTTQARRIQEILIQAVFSQSLNPLSFCGRPEPRAQGFAEGRRFRKDSLFFQGKPLNIDHTVPMRQGLLRCALGCFTALFTLLQVLQLHG